MQAVYTCLIVFAGRCAVDGIKFTLFGFHRFYVAQCSALQLLPPSAHIPCTLSVGLVCRISHNICNSGIHFCSLCLIPFIRLSRRNSSPSSNRPTHHRTSQTYSLFFRLHLSCSKRGIPRSRPVLRIPVMSSYPPR